MFESTTVKAPADKPMDRAAHVMIDHGFSIESKDDSRLTTKWEESTQFDKVTRLRWVVSVHGASLTVDSQCQQKNAESDSTFDKMKSHEYEECDGGRQPPGRNDKARDLAEEISR